MQQGRITRAAEIAYVVVILGVAGLVWHAASALPPATYDPLGPKAFPTWVAYGLAALGLIMLVRLLLGRSLGHAAHTMVVGLESVAGGHVQRPGTAILTLILAFAYATALSFRSVGFLPATAVYLFLAGTLLGPLERRRVAVVALFAVGAAILLDFLFRTIFKLDLS
jgi:hypothetical protein